jgi:hypothetical protein
MGVVIMVVMVMIGGENRHAVFAMAAAGSAHGSDFSRNLLLVRL